MKPRRYTVAFVERSIAKVDKLLEDTQRAMVPLPHPDEFGLVRYSYPELRKLLKNRGDLRYVDGFWAGWTLAKGDPS